MGGAAVAEKIIRQGIGIMGGDGDILDSGILKPVQNISGICTVEGLAQMSAALDKAVIGTTQYRFLSENVQRAEKCVTAKMKK